MQSCSKQKQSTVNFFFIYQTQDTSALQEVVSSNHRLLRQYLDDRLSTYISAKAINDSSSLDSLTNELSWLCNSYQNITHCTDKTNRLQIYKQWSSENATTKEYLDSVFVAIHSRYKNISGSIRIQQRNIYLEQLRQLFNNYQNINDTYQSASVLFYLGRAFYDAGQADSSLYYFNQCRIICQRIDHVDVLGDCELWLAYVYNLHYADYLKAQQAILLAEQLFKKTGKDDYLVYTRLQRLHILRNLYQTDRVIDNLHTFLHDSTFQENKHVLAYCQYFLGEAYYDQGLLDSATYYTNLSYNIRSSLAMQNPGLLSDIGYSKSLMGLIAQAQSDTLRAEKQYTTADSIFHLASDIKGTCMNYLRESSLLLGKGEYTKVRHQYQFVLDNSGQFEDSILALYGLAMVNYLQGEVQSAISLLQSCITKLETTRYKLPIPEMKTGMLSDKVGFFHLLASIYFEKSLLSHDTALLDSAFQVLEQSKSWSLNDNLQVTSSDMHSTNEVNIIEQISTIDQMLITNKKDSSELLVTRNRLRDSLDAIRISQVVIRNGVFADYTPPRLGEISKNLIRTGTLVLEYLISDIGCYVIAISTDTTAVIPLPVDCSQLNRKIRCFINNINHYPSVRDTAQTWRRLGQQLYMDVLPPKQLHIERYEQLLIVPSGILYTLPFATLIDSNNSFLIETHEISYIPSLTTLAILKSRDTVRDNDNSNEVVVFGDPVFSDQSISSLPYTKREVDVIKEIYGDEKVHSFIDSNATLENFESYDYRHVRYLHLATHGYTDNYRPDRSAVLFSQFDDSSQQLLLSAPRIASLTIPVNLVFLSSCQSGAGKLYPGEGVLSLAQPFLVAGANAVLATSWNVDDRSSVDFVRYFYQYFKDGNSKAASLAHAQQKLITSRYSHPYYWGSYVLIGTTDY